jgi:hypothetical protein
MLTMIPIQEMTMLSMIGMMRRWRKADTLLYENIQYYIHMYDINISVYSNYIITYL